MTRSTHFLLASFLLISGCISVPPISPSAPGDMVPAKLNIIFPTNIPIYIDTVRLESTASEGKAPFDELTGKLPLVQPQGLLNYRRSIQLTLASVGATLSETPEAANYVLRTSVLGAMAIPFPEAYSILFVHYQLEDSRTGKVIWVKNVYSQAKLENLDPAKAEGGEPNPAYARLAAANLRQMATAVADWAKTVNDEATKR